MLTRTLPAHGPGGLGAAGWDLAKALAGASAKVTLFTTADGLAGPASRDVTVRALPAPAGRYSRAWWRESLRAYRALTEGRFDVVLGVSAAANALARRPRPPAPVFVFQAHGTSAGEVASKLRSRRPRGVLGAARNLYWGLARDHAYTDYDAVVAVGEAVRRQLTAWPTSTLVAGTPVSLIRNGVDAAAFRFDAEARMRLRAELEIAPDAPLALYAGRLQADKGPHRAIHALSLALGSRPELTLVLVGDGPERERLARLVAGIGLQARVRLIGGVARRELTGWLSAADALVFPTCRSEGLPLVVLEALASGLPVLTTPQGAGDLELPCERRPAADLQGLAAAMTRLAPSQPRASRLPHAFHLDHVASAYLTLFDRLLSTAPRRPE